MLNWPAEKIEFEEEITFTNGHQLNPAVLLFEKVEDEAIDKQIEKLESKKPWLRLFRRSKYRQQG